MSKGRTSKARLGLLAALVLGLFAFVVAPAPAVAAENVGGLVFEYTNAPGETQTNIVNTNGLITVTGDADMTVTQVEVANGTQAYALQLGNGLTANYTGTITLNGVTLAGSSAVPSTSTLTFNNVGSIGGQTVTEGCTVILGENTVLSSPKSIQLTNGVVQMKSAVVASGDTLVLNSGSSIQTNQEAGATNPSIAINVTASGASTIEFAGDATVIGGIGDSNTQQDKGAITLATTVNTATLTISTNAGANPVVSGTSGVRYPAPALFVSPTVALNPVNSVVPNNVTFDGDGNLTLVGGTAAYSSAATGSHGIYILGNVATNIELVSGTLNAVGGNGADVIGATANNSTGGTGIVISNTDTTTANSSMTVSGGTLLATGGNGGNGGDVANGAGGVGIAVNGRQYNADNYTAKLAVTGGAVTAAGGNSGSKTPNLGVGGVAITGSGTASISYLTVSNGLESSDGPTVTAIAGRSASNTAAQAITGFGSDAGAGITADAGKPNATDAPYLYPYVGLTAKDGAPAADNLAQIVAFAGADNPDTPAEFGDFVNANVQWAQITPAPLTAVGASLEVAGQDAPVPYVIAQTDETMTGVVPQADRTYVASVTGTFEGLENVDLSNFANLSGINNTGKVAVTPADMVSTANSTTPGAYYVKADASGSTITVAPEGETKLPTSITNLYPNMTILGSTELPVVWTMTLNTNVSYGAFGWEAAATVTPNLDTWMWYTNPDGSGSLVQGQGLAVGAAGSGGPVSGGAASNPGSPVGINPAVPISSLDTIAKVDDTENIPLIKLNSTPVFIGWYDETAEDEADWYQVSNTDVTGWDSNMSLTAEYGTVTVNSVTPSPTTVSQGSSVQISANLTVTPTNKDLPSYSYFDSGINPGWEGVFVNTGQGTITANGLSIEQTSGSSSTSQPFAVTSVATVSANETADLGHYRFWPQAYTGAATGNPPTGSVYGVVQVVGGNGPAGGIDVIRMYNPNNGEHLYTTDPNEASTLENTYGWDNENVAWVAPATSATPIYRLYNPYNGDHLYTVSLDEYNTLSSPEGGWQGEGIKLYSANNTEAPIYRLYNPNMTANGGAYAHLWTGDYNEYVTLWQRDGWTNESVAFYALTVPNPS